MGLSTQRRLAAEILGVGESRIWIDPERIEEVSAAITREEVRRLIHEGVIGALPERGTSRARARARKRRKGPGSRKGAKGARMSEKRIWITRIRALRRYLRELRDEGVIEKHTYHALYKMAKGGFFRSKAHLRRYIQARGWWRSG